MYTIALVDDEEESIVTLTNYISNFFKDNNLEYKLTTYKDGEDIILDKSKSFDIVFMDIEMARMDGIKAAKEIRSKNDNVAIIFVTRMARFAINGYEVNALDFMVKPLEYETFVLKMKKALKYIKTSASTKIELKVADKIYYVNDDDIYYLEAYKHNIIFYTTKGIYKIYGTLKTYQDLLNKDRFASCNRGFIVNLKYVEYIGGTDVIVNNTRIPISRYKKAEFLEDLAAYCGIKG